MVTDSSSGKTGSRVAERLSAHEVSVRTAVRSGTDARFDWDNQATWEQTLRGATGLYLVSPILRIDFAGLVGRFLDQAERAPRCWPGQTHPPQGCVPSCPSAVGCDEDDRDVQDSGSSRCLGYAEYPVAFSTTIRTTTRTAPGRSSPGSLPSYFQDS